MSTEYYARLEQGRAPRPSEVVLAGIAGALRLTPEESDHLHRLAGTAPTPTGLHRRDVRPSILTLLERLPHTAGIVLSATFEVLAWNDLAAALMEDFSLLVPRDRNLARKTFLQDGQAREAIYGISDEVAFREGVVTQLRSAQASYPADPIVREVIDELHAGSAEFARLWERHDVQTPPPLQKTFRHTPAGSITVNCDSLAITERDQHLVLYTAPAGSRDAENLALLEVVGLEPLVEPRGT